MAWTGVARNRGTWKRVTRERQNRDGDTVKKGKEKRDRMKWNISE